MHPGRGWSVQHWQEREKKCHMFVFGLTVLIGHSFLPFSPEYASLSMMLSTSQPADVENFMIIGETTPLIAEKKQKNSTQYHLHLMDCTHFGKYRVHPTFMETQNQEKTSTSLINQPNHLIYPSTPTQQHAPVPSHFAPIQQSRQISLLFQISWPSLTSIFRSWE